jgi:1-aminocyclopropane-1-carboxylate deaminase
MNDFYEEHKVPTDFVYTAKMIFAVIDKIKAGYFAGGSRIVCLHTGGLQGNDSLPASTLVF